MRRKTTTAGITDSISEEGEENPRPETFASYHKKQQAIVTKEIIEPLDRIRRAVLSLEDYGISLERDARSSLVDLALMFTLGDTLKITGNYLCDQYDNLKTYDSHSTQFSDDTIDFMKKKLAAKSDQDLK